MWNRASERSPAQKQQGLLATRFDSPIQDKSHTIDDICLILFSEVQQASVRGRGFLSGVVWVSE